MLDARRDKMIAGGKFDLNGFRLGWSKSCVLFIVGIFLFGKVRLRLRARVRLWVRARLRARVRSSSGPGVAAG